MFRRIRDQEVDKGNVTGFCETWLPRVFRYVVFVVNDTGAAEQLTLNIIRKVYLEQVCYDNDERTAVPVFSEARKQVREYLTRRDGNRCLSGLTAEERDVAALRIGARLSSAIIGKLCGKSETGIRTILCEAVRKIRDSGVSCL